jgi:hypothetical protein
MALGVPAPGSVAVLMVGTTSGAVTTPVGGLTTWDWVGDSPQQTHDYYQQPSVISVGKTSRTITLNNDYETADSGHAIVYAAFTSKNTIWCKILPDGTNGETLPVKVSHQEIHGPDVNNHTTVSWTFAQQGDPTVVGTGFGT